METTAGAVGEFAGGLAMLFLLSYLWLLVLRRFVHRSILALAASVLSLITATIVGGYGFGKTSSPAFTYAFGFYAIPQIIVFVVFWWRDRCSTAGKRTDAASVVENKAALNANFPVPSIQIDADEHPAYRVSRLEFAERDQRKTWSNFFAQYWRGEYSLAASYWGVNFLGNLVLVALGGTVTALFSPEEGFEPVAIFWFVFMLRLTIAVLVVWQVVGLWRSARRHAQRQRQASRSAFWARAAQLAAVLSVLQTVGVFAQNATPQIIEMYRIAFEGDPDIPPNELELLSGGTELSVFGGIKYGLSNDVELLLQAAPEVTVLHLTSGGGRIAEANKLFKLIRDRGLDTYVSNECSSACTLAFAAGTKRTLLDGAKLGYHGLTFPGLTDEVRRAATEEWERLYQEAGLDASFVKRALAVSSNTMWYPSADELLQANAVTGIVTGEGFALSGHEIGPSLASVERDMREASGIIDALHNASPEIAQQIYVSTREGILGAKPDVQLRENVSSLIAKAVVANLVRADDETLADYAFLLSAQYSALQKKDPALCFQYAALGTNDAVASAFPPDVVALEAKLNERVLRTAIDRPAVKPGDTEVAWTLVGESMTAEEAEVLAIVPANVPPARYNEYCEASIRMLEIISDFGTSQAAMMMREMFLTE